MQLAVRDAAEILNVSEKTIYRWIKQGTIPAYKISDQYRFNRSELLEWATARKIQVSLDIFHEPEQDGVSLPSLGEALQAGGIHYRIGGGDKAAVLKSVVELLRLGEEVDRQFLLQVMLARESLGSTGIGEGIAIPHVRNPIVMHIPRPMILLCFLEHPIDFAALDGQPVGILFTLVSPTIRAHLHLLSKLAFALRDEPLKASLKAQASREEILANVARVEGNLGTAETTTA